MRRWRYDKAFGGLAAVALTAAALVVPTQLVAVAPDGATGRPVEVAAAGSPTTTVYAEPNGTMRAVLTAVPTRARRAGRWVPVDPALTRGVGVLTPTATNVPLALSAGGASTPLVRLGDGGQQLRLWWPGSLPAPRVDGAVATYPDVRNGVDLRITATDQGFTEVLVVADRTAADRLLAVPARLRVEATGLTVRTDGVGGLVAMDAAGTAVYSAPSALMWDARHRSAPVRLRLEGSSLELGIDPAMAHDPTTRYPLFVDPSFTANNLNWTDVLQQSPGVSFWNGQNMWAPTDPNGPIMVGRDPTYLTAARALFQMNTAPILGKHILGATFRITEGWANSCTGSSVDLYLTGGISSSTTWNNQPGWTTEQASVTTAHRKGDGNCPDGPVAFNATNAVTQAAANNWGVLTLGLRAANEGDANSWKRFQKDATLQIDYNSVPSVGPMTCSAAVNTLAPILAARVNDADTSENDLKGNFAWQSWNGTAWVAGGTGTDPVGRAPGTQTSWTVPGGSLADGGRYRWQVRIADSLPSPYSGTDYSAWSAWCEFTIDLTAPALPTVDATVYTAGCTTCGGVGTTGRFTLTDPSGDTARYLYGFTDPPAAALNVPATFAWTPTGPGPTTLYVQAVDAAGNVSPTTAYSFTVPAPAPELAQWLLTDPAGTTALTDTTGHGHTATLAGGSLGAPSRIAGLTALGLAGTTTNYAQTSGPLLDTSDSWTVSAWALATSLSGDQAVAGQDGVHSSAFQLQSDQSCGCWRLVVPATDATNPATVIIRSSTAVKLGVWTHLAAVYDAGAGTATLYVNGVAAGTATATAWNATGPFTIGRDRWNDAGLNYFTGRIGTVEAWARVLAPSEVRAMVDPNAGALIEANSLENPGGAGTVEIAAPDPLNLLHDLVLQGTATVPPAGAGHQGLGLALDGAGWADTSIDPDYNGTPAQVLHTDQSFTVSAWVRLGGTALPAGPSTALSQSGVRVGGFTLGYRVTGGHGVWAFAMPGADSTSTTGWTEADSPALSDAALGTWTQLTGVYDATAGTLALYVDGQLVAHPARSTVATAWDAAGPFTVGADPAGDRWSGNLDEVRAVQGVAISPLGLWSFHGCSGSPVACPDYGTGNHAMTLSATGVGVLNQALPSTAIGPVLDLTGTGDAATAGPVVTTTASFAVAAWVYLPALPTSGASTIVSESGAQQSFFELGYDADLNALCFTAWASDATSATHRQACATGALHAGAWLFVAGVYDQVGGQLRLSTAGYGGTPALVAQAAFSTPWTATGPLRVGAGYRGATTGYFTGDVTGVQIYMGVPADLATLM